MCLVIEKLYHCGIDTKPLVAKENIIVFKLLNHYVGALPSVFSTPYRAYQIDFGIRGSVGRFEYPHTELKLSSFGTGNVTEGIHAFVRPYSDEDGKLHIFHAIIPKGAKYYIGDSGDIVADKMIIFQDIQNMREYLFDRKENAMKFDAYCKELNFKIF